MIPSTNPPPEPGAGTVHGIRCTVCDFKAETEVVRFSGVDGLILATCPACGGSMVADPMQSHFGFKMPAHDFSATKQGMKRNRDLTARNEALAKKQWDHHEVKQPDGHHAVNYTPGGPLDPNGPFASRKAKPIITGGGIGPSSHS